MQKRPTGKGKFTAVVTIVFIVAAYLSVQSFITSSVVLPNASMGGASGKERLYPEQSMKALRRKQAVLQKKIEELRYQVSLTKSRDDRRTLVRMMREEQQLYVYIAEIFLLYFGTEKAAEGIAFNWPVDPGRGVSADFGDPHYLAHFGLSHEAIDIPVPQGSEVQAVADGVVSVVANNGFGYSFVILRHDGFATSYGHVSDFMVEEGQKVQARDVIALSGGQPGTPGAGPLTTGPHLHFELIAGGKKIDPLPYLPYSPSVQLDR